MARMGYKEGQGLGRQEQGMSIALQVEKTSKKIGKIIHEKDLHKCWYPVVDRQIEKWMNAWWMDGWNDEWMNEWMVDGWNDEWVDKWMIGWWMKGSNEVISDELAI